MKKILLTMAFVLGVIAANAQMWIGGGLGAQIKKNYTEFSITPEVGCVLSNHWHVGLGANYSFSQEKGTDLLGNDVITNVNKLFLQPYVRYVLTIIDAKFVLFFDLCGDFGLIDASGWAATLRPGISWMATKHWTAAFSFSTVQYDHGLYGNDNAFKLNFDLAVPQIRIYYTF